MTFTINSHPEALQATLDIWFQVRQDPALPESVKEKLASLMTAAPEMERKVMVPELVFANADLFDEATRQIAAALIDFSVTWDFWGMRSSGRGAAIAAALRGIEGFEVPEPLDQFVTPPAPIAPPVVPAPPLDNPE